MAIELAEEQQAGGALTPVADAVTTALAEITKTNTTFTELASTGRELAERYKNVVADVHTTKGYEQIAAIRTELREKVRYPMQKLKKDGSKMLGDIRLQFNERATALIEEAEAHERPFQELLDAEDARKAAEKREREEAEQRRKQMHVESIGAITNMATDAAGMDIPALESQLEAARGILVDDSYEEFQGQAQQAKDEAVRKIEAMLVAARLDEEDRRIAEEARQRQAAYAAEQAERAKQAEAQAAAEREKAAAAEREAAELRAKVAAMEAEQERQREERERAARERAEAVQRRIDSFTSACSPETAESFANAIAVMEHAPITAEWYGERTADAQAAKDKALAELREKHAAAVQHEREEAERAQAARIQELIDNIHGMGENALLAVEDGSADVAELRANLKVLEDLELSELNGREQEAALAREGAISKVCNAIQMTEERDRLRAEQEAEDARRRAEHEAASELARIKRAHGEALYEMVRRGILSVNVSSTAAAQWLNDANALLLRINPNEDFED